ncbi:TIM-barrel domain-containing protein [Paenibacillus ginsengarvi]|nr:TIM-barrel domain-containing protein [Paenibacillus ginsengarvi]
MSTTEPFVSNRSGEGLQQTTFVHRLASGSYMRIEAISPHSFRIRMDETDSFPEPPLVRYGIVVHPEADFPCSVRDAGDLLSIHTGQAVLDVHKESGQLSLRKANGALLTSHSIPPWSSRKAGFGTEFALAEDEQFYGLGDVTREQINLRGHRADMWVQNVKSYAPIPFLMSSKGWALFMNTTSRHAVDIGKTAPDRMRLWGRSGQLDFYLFAADGYENLLDSYTDLTGKPQLLPMWAYGLTFVCNQQADAKEMLTDALNFRREGIPCDLIGLEPGWMDKHYDYSTNKKWHPERFYLPYWADKGPGTFIGALDRLGFKLSLWLCSEYDLTHHEERLLAGGEEDVSASEDESFVPHADDYEQDVRLQQPTYLDKITKPDEAWFTHLQKFVDQGVSAFKLDASNQTLEHPDRLWGNGLPDNEMHNLYPLLLGKQMHLGFKEHTGQRSMIYTAGGYAGIQQYAATWAGDTGGGPKPLVSVLNHGMSGHANTSCDMEVFTSAGIHFGFLQPWSQVNSWAYWRHPWLLSKPLLEMFKLYAKLRYKLLPYLYSAAHVAARTGFPIARAMPLAFPDDPRSSQLLQQYMLGDSLLVAAFADTVYLPEGEWIDYWTGAHYFGPQELPTSVPAYAGGPLFVRAGAIIPEWPEMDFVGEKPVDTIGLNVYPFAGGEFTLYEDDGMSYSYQDGQVAVTKISCRTGGGITAIEIGLRSGEYAGMPEHRSYELSIHTAAKPKQVTVNRVVWQEATDPGTTAASGAPASAWTFDSSESIVRLLAAEDRAKADGVIVELSH